MWKYPLLLSLHVIAAVSFMRNSREYLLGLCHNASNPPTLDLERWVARSWYEMARFSNNFEENTDCVIQALFIDGENNGIDFGFSLRYSNGSKGILQGKGEYAVVNGGLIINASFPQDSSKSSYVILSTDYDNYAVVYSCWQISTGSLPEKQERVWVLSRERSLPNELFQKLINESLVIDGEDLTRFLEDVQHIDC